MISSRVGETTCSIKSRVSWDRLRDCEFAGVWAGRVMRMVARRPVDQRAMGIVNCRRRLRSITKRPWVRGEGEVETDTKKVCQREKQRASERVSHEVSYHLVFL